VYSNGAINEQHVLNWWRSLKGGRTMCDCVLPPVYAHYLNSSSGKFFEYHAHSPYFAPSN